MERADHPIGQSFAALRARFDASLDVTLAVHNGSNDRANASSWNSRRTCGHNGFQASRLVAAAVTAPAVFADIQAPGANGISELPLRFVSAVPSQ